MSKSMSIPTISKAIKSQRQTTYKENDVIYFNINANEIPLLNPYGTFLRFYVTLAAGNCCPALDWAAGAYSCIRQLDVLTKDGVLLESIQDLNGWVAVKKHFERNRSLYGVWNLEEGLTDPADNEQSFPGQSIQNRPVQGLAQTRYYDLNNTINGACGTYIPRKVEVCLPLSVSGILGGDKVFPVAAMSGGGLEVRVHLETNNAALRNWDVYMTSQAEIPFPFPAPVAGNPHPAPNPAPGNGTNLYLKGGEAGGGALTPGLAVADVPDTIVCFAGTALAAQLNSCVPTNGDQVPACIGRRLCYEDDAGLYHYFFDAAGPVTITAVEIDTAGTNLKFTLSAAISAIVAANVAAAGNKVWLDNQNCSGASYVIDNAELVCGSVEPSNGYFDSLMKKVQSEGGLDLSIKTLNLYRNNLNAGITKSQLLIPTSETRAKGIVTTPRDAVPSNLGKSEFMPESDNLTSYQFVLGSKLVPDRKVETDRFSLAGNNWNAIAQSELSKALSVSGINARSLVNIGGMFSIGRKLAEANHSYNAKDKDTRLDLEYNGAAPVKNKQFQTQVYHIRNINVRPTGVVVSF
tara:strand:- start:205 stop:1932 length:1728 start_codon:yes stop_codon:yes gene_type:complete